MYDDGAIPKSASERVAAPELNVTGVVSLC
jgi:hypothetical protein